MYKAFSYRADPAVPTFPDDRPIIIFDGKCVLCSSFVHVILRVDRRRRFRLLAAQSEIGAALYRHYGLDSENYTTNILLTHGLPWFKSEGSIMMFERLGPPWSLLAMGRLLPRSLRDVLYEILARNRLRWFGVRDTCYVAQPGEADRFIA